jgi:hypothetical protein
MRGIVPVGPTLKADRVRPRAMPDLVGGWSAARSATNAPPNSFALLAAGTFHARRSLEDGSVGDRYHLMKSRSPSVGPPRGGHRCLLVSYTGVFAIRGCFDRTRIPLAIARLRRSWMALDRRKMQKPHGFAGETRR